MDDNDEGHTKFKHKNKIPIPILTDKKVSPITGKSGAHFKELWALKPRITFLFFLLSNLMFKWYLYNILLIYVEGDTLARMFEFIQNISKRWTAKELLLNTWVVFKLPLTLSHNIPAIQDHFQTDLKISAIHLY